MSKNTTIREGPIGRAFGGVSKLKTNLTGGGTCLWVPKDERQLETLNAEQNGTYRPAKYGFSGANVRVPSQSGRVTGYGQDGNEYTITEDEGDLVKTKIPSSIDITTEPARLDYADGDTIDFTGLVVKAYDGEGNLYDVTGYSGGVVPNGELIFPVTTAQYSGGGGGAEGEYVSPSGQIQVGNQTITGPIYAKELVCAPIEYQESRAYAQQYVLPGNYGFEVETLSYYILRPGSVSTPSSVRRMAYINGKLYIASTSKYGYKYTRVLPENTFAGEAVPTTKDSELTLNGQTVYYRVANFDSLGNFGASDPEILITESDQASGRDDYICWYMIYGDMQYHGSTDQTVPVNWPRPGDGKILTDSFVISVHPAAASGGEEQGGGSGSGGSGEGGGGGGHSF